MPTRTTRKAAAMKAYVLIETAPGKTKSVKKELSRIAASSLATSGPSRSTGAACARRGRPCRLNRARHQPLDLGHRVIDLHLDEHFAKRRAGFRGVAAHTRIRIAASGRNLLRPHVLGIDKQHLGRVEQVGVTADLVGRKDRKSTRLNSSH